MSSKVVYPSLSVDGWVSNTSKVADYIMSSFFLSDYSQTYLYIGFVASFPWILQETQSNMSELTLLTQKTLSKYFTDYFDNVVVEVSEVINTVNPSKGQISIYVSFTDSEGQNYSLGRLIKTINSKIDEIITINNG